MEETRYACSRLPFLSTSHTLFTPPLTHPQESTASLLSISSLPILMPSLPLLPFSAIVRLFFQLFHSSGPPPHTHLVPLSFTLLPPLPLTQFSIFVLHTLFLPLPPWQSTYTPSHSLATYHPHRLHLSLPECRTSIFFSILIYHTLLHLLHSLIPLSFTYPLSLSFPPPFHLSPTKCRTSICFSILKFHTYFHLLHPLIPPFFTYPLSLSLPPRIHLSPTNVVLLFSPPS